MKTKHTPGPWKYRYEGSGDYEVYSEHGEEIGTAWSKDAHFLGLGKEADTNEANAKLIVAAPELLSLVRWIEENSNASLNRDDVDYNSRVVLATISDNCAKIIAKAEGQ